MPTFMVEHEVEFEVYCSCGRGLCQESTANDGDWRASRRVTVEPCPDCIERAREKGYDDGYEEARAEYEAAEREED